MTTNTTELSEVGHARVVFAPEMELTLPATQELASIIEHWSGTKGLTVHWQADHRSPEVLVQAEPRHFDRVVDQVLAKIGGCGALGTPEEPATKDRERRGSVLIVTSDPAMREILVMMSNVMGLAPEDVETYADAEARVRRREYDLLMVGGMDVETDDAGALLRALDPYLAMTTPVLFWTEAFLADAPAWLDGLSTPLLFMSRPNDFHDIREKVRRALEWRHLIRLRRRVRRHIEEQVAGQMRSFSADLLGPSSDPGAAGAVDSTEEVAHAAVR